MSAADGAAPRVDVGDEARERRYLPAVQPKRGVRWSPDEDAVLHESYRERGPRWCTAALSGRTESAVRQRARALGIRLQEQWTEAEEGILRREWGEAGDKTLRLMLPGRTWCGIAQKAAAMELGDPAQGKFSVELAVERTGLCRAQLLRVLEEEGVQVCHRPRAAPTKRHRRGRPKAGSTGRSRSGFRWLVVDLDRAAEAVDAWMKRRAGRMSCVQAADHCNVDKTTMRWALLMLAATRPVEGMPRGRAWLVSAADAEAAMALYREQKAEERAARIAAGGFR